ncbi:WhiB family transcriptional regulator [Actinokineospora globicatena]|uniref:Transcriptional regulator WhiB n=1 Tax=Actinokineospora globicatena TaxID=103729 RepID=A0A9W6QST9_9PSEU|nr:WhiB family transcriptional regulator [Actinokineospora globicatena]MCP2304959.1 WhiB family transcriptional regulator, redox-sensing transcriptional regulator [Actinokineospora globicatena]GLW80419.1 transcriptional regulator WhiB [Actinokineospora globicatena]GLW87247.1 transcriptional regulator WhiB [Actinokineospora globicatena]GLW94019.1 transcriptional regulator WhiB [Actinokineospora globicatena]
MSTATAPLQGAFPDYMNPTGSGVSELLDAAPSAGLELPCRSTTNPDLWFADAPAELERAKVLCGDCPVRAACLASALARHEPWGVWGGEIFERGVVIARKRPRGRPRKEDIARDAAELVAREQDEVAA